jgi:hypothetical protein
VSASTSASSSSTTCGPAHPAQRVELVPEPPPRVGVAQPVAQHLDGHGAVVGGDAEEDGAHAALAEPAEQAVRTDRRRVGRAQRAIVTHSPSTTLQRG